MAAKQGSLGLDLSLRSTGACWLPYGWTGDTTKARVMTYGRECDGSERDKAKRMGEIAHRVLMFAKKHVSPNGVVYVENYAHGMAMQANAAQIRELGGVVKHVLFSEWGLEVIPLTASEARKTLLSGKLPRKGVKDFVVDQVRRQLKGEAVYWNEDQIDAMVIANAGLAMQGGPPISFPVV